MKLRVIKPVTIMGRELEAGTLIETIDAMGEVLMRNGEAERVPDNISEKCERV